MQSRQSTELISFMEAAKSKGISDEFLTALLVHQGWPKDQIFTALGVYWEGVAGMALPQRAGRGESSRDAFLYLLSFATLATWASALGSMLFRFIELWFPDPIVLQPVNVRSMVTWQMACVAVAFPIFLLVMRTILAEAGDQPERLQSDVRKWLTYIALLLTSGGLITDLIYFFDYFLTGELTTRFLLKALTVLVICTAIFIYYLGSLRWEKQNDLAPARRQSLAFGAGAMVLVLIVFCGGFGLAGTPSAQRLLEADKRRVQNLRTIASSIHTRFERLHTAQPGKPLPSSLGELASYGLNSAQSKDPQTQALYDYRPTAGSNYDLCATFSAASERDRVPMSEFWYHGRGTTCFTLDASAGPTW